MKPGAGRAQRYVNGKMPINTKNSSRKEQSSNKSKTAGNNALAMMNSAMTEEQRMEAMFAAQSEQWTAQKEELAL
jgi:protein MPE1